MIRTSIGKGKFHFLFKEVENFIMALDSFYLKESNKRCWAIVSDQDNLMVIQPSVSTPGLSVLILNTEKLAKDRIEQIKKLLINKNVDIINVDYLRRPSQAQGFTLGFKEVSNFIEALKIFYFAKKERCRVIVPKSGDLVVQPSVSTPELNTLILEEFSFMAKKEEVMILVSSLQQIKCDSILNSFKTSNF